MTVLGAGRATEPKPGVLCSRAAVQLLPPASAPSPRPPPSHASPPPHGVQGSDAKRRALMNHFSSRLAFQTSQVLIVLGRETRPGRRMRVGVADAHLRISLLPPPLPPPTHTSPSPPPTVPRHAGVGVALPRPLYALLHPGSLPRPHGCAGLPRAGCQRARHRRRRRRRAPLLAVDSALPLPLHMLYTT